MNVKEFIDMQKQDIETAKPADKKILSEVVAAMEAVLVFHPEAELDPKKTAEDCYQQMYSVANRDKKNGYYVFTPTGTMKFICGYLGVEEIPIFAAPPAATAGSAQPEKPAKEAKKRRSLEDFF